MKKMAAIMVDAIDILSKVVAKHAENGTEANFYNLYQGLTLDVIGMIFVTLALTFGVQILPFFRSMWAGYESQLPTGRKRRTLGHGEENFGATGTRTGYQEQSYHIQNSVVRHNCNNCLIFA